MFEEWLGEHFPDRNEKVLNQVRPMRSGELYESEYGKRMTGKGIHAEKIARLFEIVVRKAKLNCRRHELCTAHFRRPPENQMELFE